MEKEDRSKAADMRFVRNFLRRMIYPCAFAAVIAAHGSVPSRAEPPAPKAGDIPLIASNFDVDSELVPSWGNGNIPKSAAPDVVGAFRFLCAPGQIAYDDPVVYPGQPGKSHLHQFFGNMLANANSTYESLRTTGDSTCNNKLNRSAYWIPAMLDGKGHVVKPKYVADYYKRLPKDSPECQKRGEECVAQPDGIRYITGFDMLGGKTTGGPKAWCRGKTYPNMTIMIEKCGAEYYDFQPQGQLAGLLGWQEP